MKRNIGRPALVALIAAISIGVQGLPAMAGADVNLDAIAAFADSAASRIDAEREPEPAKPGKPGGPSGVAPIDGERPTPGQTAPVAIKLPKDKSSAVQLGTDSTPVSLRLPDVGVRGVHDVRGLTVRDGEKTDIVLREAARSAQIMTVLEDEASAKEYTYTVDGAEFVQLDGGAVGVFRETGEAGVAEVVAYIETPWAVDADGDKLPTSYEINGNQLTQTIDTAGATFPVVADPSVKREKWWPFTVVVTLNAKDQRIILSSGGAAIGAAIGAAVCSASGPGAIACAAVGALIVTAVAETIKEYGVKDGCNIKARWVLGKGVRSVWRSGKC